MQRSDDAPVSRAFIALWRVVGPRERTDILRLGDYNLSPSGGGKYFSLSEGGARGFARHPFNRGRILTLTRINIPHADLDLGFMFNDVGGAGPSVHFGDDVLPVIYEHAGLSGGVQLLGPP